MKTFKIKTVQIIMITILICSAFINIGFAEEIIIKDLNLSSNYAKESIITLSEMDIINGDQNGNFKPYKPVTRSEIITMIVKVLEIDTNNLPDNATFKDVPKDHWAFKYVEAAYREGIIRGLSADEFGRDKECTREQMATMFINALGLTEKQELEHVNNLNDKEQVSDWAKDKVEITLATGLMSGVGANTFAPKGYAKREQVAVVMDKFIKNKEKILEQFRNKDSKKELQVYFNGDKIKFDIEPVIEDGVILVPISFFDKYLFASFHSSYFDKIGSVFMERPQSPPNNEYKNIMFKSDYNNAYKNIQGDPYENEAEYKDKLIVLEATPKKVNGTILVPFKQISEFFGMEYYMDKPKNIVYLRDDNAPTHPSLYFTLRKYVYFPYKGEMSSNMNLNVRGRGTGDYSNVRYNEYYKINEENFESTINLAIDGSDPNQESIEKTYGVILLNKILYVKDFDEGTWIEQEANGVIPEDSEAQGIVIDRNLYIDYKDYSITNEGEVEIDGLTTTKYVIKLDNDQIKSLMIEGNYGYLKPILEEVYDNNIKYIIEIYINDKHEIVKEVFAFNGVIEDETEKIDVNMLINVDFKNIGKEIEITAPNKSEIQVSH
ncbi:S-layer homology domain-containing protein [Anaeromicrobium sediminis]|uniref:SLH domain-containing protein n=1 Tax=Anaeromicrobium sediminis TaxID=1478221 RepID=A0A267MNX4_9FIRM|nr:S-layer homology domain-containing protein [Anaeromicrobium sediminis]PAB61107.1 hypothetical protein CCE28_01375 [Anaeromicrobium sediminis]